MCIRDRSYYYNDEFAKGSKQFRDDVLRSPLDVEEIVWDIACLLRMDSSKFPHPDQMSLPKGKTDRRPIMGTVYALFRGEASEEDLAKAGHSGGHGEEFYADLYLGLFNEAIGENYKAENYIRSAVKTKYAQVVGSKDYMVDVAKVHCQLRHIGLCLSRTFSSFFQTEAVVRFLPVQYVRRPCVRVSGFAAAFFRQSTTTATLLPATILLDTLIDCKSNKCCIGYF